MICSKESIYITLGHEDNDGIMEQDTVDLIELISNKTILTTLTEENEVIDCDQIGGSPILISEESATAAGSVDPNQINRVRRKLDFWDFKGNSRRRLAPQNSQWQAGLAVETVTKQQQILAVCGCYGVSAVRPAYHLEFCGARRRRELPLKNSEVSTVEWRSRLQE